MDCGISEIYFTIEFPFPAFFLETNSSGSILGNFRARTCFPPTSAFLKDNALVKCKVAIAPGAHSNLQGTLCMFVYIHLYVYIHKHQYICPSESQGCRMLGLENKYRGHLVKFEF